MSLPMEAPACPPGDRFPLGRLAMTQGAETAIEEAGDDPFEFLSRHASADWGEACEEERWLNERAIARGLRILSSYRTSRKVPIWVVTEPDRSLTTILLAPGGLPLAGTRLHPAPAGRGDDRALGQVVCPECGSSDFRHVERVERQCRVKGFDQSGTLVVEGAAAAVVGKAPETGRLVCGRCHAQLDLPDEVFFL